MTLAAGIVAVMLTGGWMWWDAVDRDDRRQRDKPSAVETTVTAGDARTLTLLVTGRLDGRPSKAADGTKAVGHTVDA
jgi:hypothetical protein